MSISWTLQSSSTYVFAPAGSTQSGLGLKYVIGVGTGFHTIMYSSDGGKTFGSVDPKGDGSCVIITVCMTPDGSVAYACDRTYGVWKSTNHGASWTLTAAFSTTTSGNAISFGGIDCSPDGSVVAVTGSIVGVSNQECVQVSTDSGATRAHITNVTNGAPGNLIRINPVNTSIIVIGGSTSYSLFISTNQGSSFSAASNHTSGSWNGGFFSTDGSVLIVADSHATGGYGKYYKSTDNGNTLTVITNTVPPYSYLYQIGYFYTDNSHIIVGSESSVYTSSNLTSFTSESIGTTNTHVVASADGSCFFASDRVNTKTWTGAQLISSSTTLTTNANPVQYLDAITVSASVSGSGATPTGNVDFYDNGQSIISTTLSGGSGTSSYSIGAPTSMKVGTHTLTAVYSGDSVYSGSTSSAVYETVNKADPYLVVTTGSSLTNSFGSSITLTAACGHSGSGPTVYATGSVTFKDNGSSIGTGTIDASLGVATLITTSLPVGSDTITATYPGDSNFNSQSVSTLNPVFLITSTTTTAILSSSNPSAFGSSVTFSAVVSSDHGGGTPGGTVVFKSDGTSIGIGTISGGTATFATSSLSLGSHTMTAVYNGDGLPQFLGSTSSPISQSVEYADAIVLSFSPTSVEFGHSVVLTATVTSTTLPTGHVTFIDGTSTLGTAVLSGTGSISSTTFTTSNVLSVGSHSLTAEYSGDLTSLPSTSTEVTLTIGLVTWSPSPKKQALADDPDVKWHLPKKLTHSGVTWILNALRKAAFDDTTINVDEATKRNHLLFTAPPGIWMPKRKLRDIEEFEEEGVIKKLGSQAPFTYFDFSAESRGLYRIFNTSGYRFYWSNSGPPVAGSTPQAVNNTLVFTSSASLSDGTWYVSVSYFDGVLDSGFMPIGPRGQTYLTVVISGGVALPTAPSGPTKLSLRQIDGGVPQINGYYTKSTDGVNAADHWAVSYTTDGSTPPNNSPSFTPTMAGSLAILSLSLPAQTDGTVVKVQVQTRRLVSVGVYAYSLPSEVQSITIKTSGPSSPIIANIWSGPLPEIL